MLYLLFSECYLLKVSFSTFTLSMCLFLELRWTSWKQHNVASCILVYPALCACNCVLRWSWVAAVKESAASGCPLGDQFASVVGWGMWQMKENWFCEFQLPFFSSVCLASSGSSGVYKREEVGSWSCGSSPLPITSMDCTVFFKILRLPPPSSVAMGRKEEGCLLQARNCSSPLMLQVVV